MVGTHFSGGFFAYNKQYIQSLPIVIPTGQLEINIRDQIIDLSKKIFNLYQTSAVPLGRKNAELLTREAIVYEEKIDAFVYELYGLTDEEKQVVEDS